MARTLRRRKRNIERSPLPRRPAASVFTERLETAGFAAGSSPR